MPGESKTVAALPKSTRGAGGHILAGLSLFGLLAVYGIGDSRWQLIAIAIGSSLVCLAVCLAVRRLLPQYYAMRLLIVSYGLQFMALAAIAVLGLPLSPPYHPFEVNAAEAPFRVVGAMLTVPAGALMAAIAWWVISRSSPLFEQRESLDDIARSRRVYLVVAAIVMLLYWPAALEDSGTIGYVGRILVSALMVAPFLAGHDSRTDRPLAALWSVAILLNVVVGIAAGTRSVFIAAVLFCAGYVSALPRERRLVVGACAALAMVPLIQLAGALGVVRDELGRGGLELLRPDHVREVFDGILRHMTPADKQNSEQVTLQGVGRFLSWTNVVVPLMTPESIPYRRSDGFVDEAAQTFRIASISGQSLDEVLDAGLLNAPAREYGFTVNSNTSFDFTLVADGWSRGGAPVALLFSFIAALAFTVGELCAFRLHRYGTGVSTILALPAAKAAFVDSTTYPLLLTLRSMILYTLTAAALVVIVESIRRITQDVRRQRVTRTTKSVVGRFPHGPRPQPMGIQAKT